MIAIQEITTTELHVVVSHREVHPVKRLSYHWAKQIYHLNCDGFLALLEEKYSHLLETASRGGNFRGCDMLELEELAWHWRMSQYCKSVVGAKAPTYF